MAFVGRGINTVRTVGNQDVDGVKSFSSVLRVASTGNNSNDVVNLSYLNNNFTRAANNTKGWGYLYGAILLEYGVSQTPSSTVTFQKPFKSTPAVFLTPTNVNASSSTYSVNATEKSATSFKPICSGSVNVSWFAIGEA